MKNTGIIRNLDTLGRVVLPKELRKTFNLNTHSSLEIYTDGDLIILKKYEPTCTFCGSLKDVVEYKGKKVCKNCIKELGKK